MLVCFNRVLEMHNSSCVTIGGLAFGRSCAAPTGVVVWVFVVVNMHYRHVFGSIFLFGRRIDLFQSQSSRDGQK